MKDLKVLIVEDEPAALKLFSSLLNKFYDVATAESVKSARALMSSFKPDLVISDIRMPNEDGLVLLHDINQMDPNIPVILITGHATKDIAINALKAGAFDFLEKPFSNEQFLAAVNRAAGMCYLSRLDKQLYNQVRSQAALPKAPQNFAREPLIAMGASFGGIDAITEVLMGLPETIPPTLIVQHGPEVVVTHLASKLNELCPFHVKVAEPNEILEHGKALVVPKGKRLNLDKINENYRIELLDCSKANEHCPSVDDLFHVVAETAGPHAIGLILTGMGQDGALGLLEMRSQGALTIAQEYTSCSMAGMPKAAVEQGAVQKIIPLKEIPHYLLEVLSA